jgi:hypothetical protein
MCTLSGSLGCPSGRWKRPRAGRALGPRPDPGPDLMAEAPKVCLVDRPGQEELAPSQPEADRPVPVAPRVHLLPSGHRSVVGKAPEHRVRACRT